MSTVKFGCAASIPTAHTLKFATFPKLYSNISISPSWSQNARFLVNQSINRTDIAPAHLTFCNHLLHYIIYPTVSSRMTTSTAALKKIATDHCEALSNASIRHAQIAPEYPSSLLAESTQTYKRAIPSCSIQNTVSHQSNLCVVWARPHGPMTQQSAGPPMAPPPSL